MMDVFTNANKVFESSIHKLNEEHNAKIVDLMQTQIRSLSDLYQHSMEEQERLRAVIADLEDQNKSFMNVSLIIATKNENIRLQNEIQLLTKRLKYYENTRPHMNRLDHSSDVSDDIEKKVQSVTIEEVFIRRQNDNKSCNNVMDYDDNKNDESPEEGDDQPATDVVENDEEEEISVVERLIEGTTYFVSDDEHMLVYERVYEDDDWEIGEEIGHAFYDEQNVLRLIATN